MEWSIDNGNTWIKVTDHGRAALSVSVERIEASQRMANGLMRRYVVAKKRSFECSWENLPDKDTTFLANGTTYGRWFENFYNTTDGAFLMRLRSGSDIGKTSLVRVDNVGLDDMGRIFTVMLTDYTKEILKRGTSFDMWSLSLTLEEV
jgi:hypothetical protein